MRSDLQRVPWFAAVGFTAMGVHLGVVALLVEQLLWQPSIANVAGFLIAFVVSFCGHYFLTFRDLKANALQAILRFFAIAVLGFALNQLAYILALGYFGSRAYIAVLGCILLAVAVLTFVLSRHWGFNT